MEWKTGDPKEEGKYLTIREYRVGSKISFSDPRTSKFAYCRYRRTNEIVISDEGIETCWVGDNYRAEVVDYWMPIPKNPK